MDFNPSFIVPYRTVLLFIFEFSTLSSCSYGVVDSFSQWLDFIANACRQAFLSHSISFIERMFSQRLPVLHIDGIEVGPRVLKHHAVNPPAGLCLVSYSYFQQLVKFAQL